MTAYPPGKLIIFFCRRTRNEIRSLSGNHTYYGLRAYRLICAGAAAGAFVLIDHYSAVLKAHSAEFAGVYARSHSYAAILTFASFKAFFDCFFA